MGNVDSAMPADWATDPFVGERLSIGMHSVEVLRKLAEGGFAQVYLAKNVFSNQTFVLKRVRLAVSVWKGPDDRSWCCSFGGLVLRRLSVLTSSVFVLLPDGNGARADGAGGQDAGQVQPSQHCQLCG